MWFLEPIGEGNIRKTIPITAAHNNSKNRAITNGTSKYWYLDFIQ
jgi:hypothetical protein